MSALCGIYVFDGGPVDEDLLVAMGNSLGARGPDGGRQVVQGSVGMAYRAFHINSESRIENQPLLLNDGLVFCWDGRLDNGKEVMETLALPPTETLGDAAIVLASYLRWGSDFLKHITGDFALALWDPAERALVLARDPTGTRTLYYHVNKTGVVWSTEFEALLDIVGVDPEINDEYIAGFVSRFPEAGETPYKRIAGVPPAQMVIVKGNNIRTQRFWGLDPGRETRYRTDAEYEDHFRQVFREAVSCRLRAEAPVWAELSGGLDSSSIVCTADDIINGGGANAPSLETVSLVYDEAKICDERHYIRYVEVKRRKTSHLLREDDHRILAPDIKEAQMAIPNHALRLAKYYRALSQSMLSSGSRVLLSGEGGDEILGSNGDPSPELTELLGTGKLIQLHRRLRVWSRALNVPYHRILWIKAIVRLFPPRLQCVCRRSTMVPEMYDRRLVRRQKLRIRNLGPLDIFGHGCRSGKDWAITYLLLVRALSAGYWREFCSVDITYPFTHVPLVEFMHSIPFDQKVRPYESRSLLRRAMRSLLPDEIATRKDKTGNADAVLRAVRRELVRLEEMFKDARVCSYGYVSRSAMSEMLDGARNGHELSCHYLAFLYSLECWLRGLDRRRSSSVIRQLVVESVLG